MPAAAAHTLRAFVALDLDPTSVRRVARVADRLRMGSGAPSAAWTPSAKIHVTVKFLGIIARDLVDPLSEEIGRLATGKAAPSPGGFGLHAFPSPEAAELVVALLADPRGEVTRLATRVEKIASKHGVPAESREFRPHVTLARLKMPYDVRRWLRPDLAPGTDACRVSRLTIFESRPGDQGTTYVPLATFPYETAGERPG
jgi:2'-5' RNA ligase